MHRKYYILYLLLLVCAFTACTPRSLREAQSVVAQADSLWLAGKLYGMDEGDIAHLAGELPLDGEIERSFQKIIEDGRVLIRNGKTYTAIGAEIK